MVGHRYTEEEHKFLKSFIPGHTYKEIVSEYNKRFEEPITESRVKGYMGNHKINNGLTGRFKKGQIPFNKGQKGVCAKGCEKTWFADGNLPHNTKPIGYERITKDGYIEVKIKMRPSHSNCNDNFKAKHHLVWEEAHGPIPKGYKITFLDGNKQNCVLENLALITNAEHLQMTKQGLRSKIPQITETGILIARVGVTSKNARKRRDDIKRAQKDAPDTNAGKKGIQNVL